MRNKRYQKRSARAFSGAYLTEDGRLACAYAVIIMQDKVLL